MKSNILIKIIFCLILINFICSCSNNNRNEFKILDFDEIQILREAVTKDSIKIDTI